jgi:hypothetical protein
MSRRLNANVRTRKRFDISVFLQADYCHLQNVLLLSLIFYVVRRGGLSVGVLS